MRENCFYVGTIQRISLFSDALHSDSTLIVTTLYTLSGVGASVQSRVEAGSNTFTVTLRDAGGDAKGSLEFETVKYCRESDGTRTRE
jgi:hypothetical protein